MKNIEIHQANYDSNYFKKQNQNIQFDNLTHNNDKNQQSGNYFDFLDKKTSQQIVNRQVHNFNFKNTSVKNSYKNQNEKFTLTDYLIPTENHNQYRDNEDSFLTHPTSKYNDIPKKQNNIIHGQNTNISKSQQKQLNKLHIDKLAYQWSNILKFVEKNDLESAYYSVLDMRDDLYLLRLMVKTGNCMSKLSFDLQKKVSSRINSLDNLDYLRKCVQDFSKHPIYENPKNDKSSSYKQTGQSIFSKNTQMTNNKYYDMDPCKENAYYENYQRLSPNY